MTDFTRASREACIVFGITDINLGDLGPRDRDCAICLMPIKASIQDQHLSAQLSPARLTWYVILPYLPRSCCFFAS